MAALSDEGHGHLEVKVGVIHGECNESTTSQSYSSPPLTHPIPSPPLTHSHMPFFSLRRNFTTQGSRYL